MTFDHHAEDPVVAVPKLAADVGPHLHLIPVLFLTVGVTEIHHDAGRQVGSGQLGRGGVDTPTVKVGSFPAAQYDVAGIVAPGGINRRVAFLAQGQEVVRHACRANRVHGNLHRPFRAVLEPDRAGQPRGQFPVHLAFRGARTDGAPAYQVRDVLRGDDVEKLGAGRDSHFVKVQQQCAGQPHPFVDAETVVQVGVVDQPFPAHGSPGFLEIHPHDDQ